MMQTMFKLGKINPGHLNPVTLNLGFLNLWTPNPGKPYLKTQLSPQKCLICAVSFFRNFGCLKLWIRDLNFSPIKFPILRPTKTPHHRILVCWHELIRFVCAQ